MSRLTWVETPDGWLSGRYRIERIDREWALTVEEEPGGSGRVLVPARVETTSISLKDCKVAAERLEARLERSRLLWRNGIWLGVMLAAFLAVTLFLGGLVLPLGVPLLFVAALRAAAVVELLTGRAWDDRRHASI